MCLAKDDVELLDGKQRSVNEAAFNQNWIVYGPAGTGKTILGLARLERSVNMAPNEDHIFLSKSKMLGRWVEQAAEQMGIGNNIHSFDQFVWNRVKHYLGRDPEKVEPNATWSEIDWDKTNPLLEKAFATNKTLKKFNVIVDEAQDVRPGFFTACRIMCNNVFVLMDENQKTGVFADTPRAQVADLLGVDNDHQIYLGINYRNPLEIKNLSEVFYTGRPDELAQPAPEERRKMLEAPPTIRWIPFSDDKARSDQVSRILSYCRDRPQVTVCVVAPTTLRVNVIHRVLQEDSQSDKRLSRIGNWSVRKYESEKFKPCTTDFCSPGIVVATPVNLKGSEFDAVFLTDWESSADQPPSMYTLICRAKARIEVLADPSESSKQTVRTMFAKALEENLITEAN